MARTKNIMIILKTTFLIRWSARLLLTGGLAVFFISANCSAATGDDYPNKPIHLIIPFPPGGAVDILGRLIGQSLSEQFNQSVIIENRPGANGNIAMEALAKMPADGYSLLIGGNGIATNSLLYPSSTYRMPQDFSTIGYVGRAPLIMVVPEQAPYQSLGDVITAAKKNPGAVTFASAGSGSSAHLGAELLSYTTKIELTHIAYKGGAPAIVDLVGNRVSFMLLDLAQALPQLQTGRLRAIVVGTPEKLDVLPKVPSMTDAGYPQIEATVWWGLIGPANIPEAIANKINAGLNHALTDTAIVKKLTEFGVTPKPGTTQQFRSFILSEINKWSAVMKNVKMKED
jgi:tripartite-type tricarboxylate transporter receptor subunit TctC